MTPSAYCATSAAWSAVDTPSPTATGRLVRGRVRATSSGAAADTDFTPVTPMREAAYTKPLVMPQTTSMRSSVAVDRAGHARALKDMTRQARARLDEGRQIVIFPEGTRNAPGAPGDYKPGVAAIYRDLEGPCWPVATNSGVCWPAHGFRRYPGLVVFEFLEPIPAGLKRGPMMALLESRIEEASLGMLEPKAELARIG